MTTDTVKPADAELLRVTADDIRDLYCSLIGDERAARLRALAEVLERCAAVELIRAIDTTADDWIDAADSMDAPAGPHYAGMRAFADYLASMLSESDKRRLERRRELD